MITATIKWLSELEGGKKELPPLNENYYPMIKIEGYEETFNWSFTLVNLEKINDLETISKIYFLMPNAPHHLLSSGSKFTIHIGSSLIGHGIIN